ncbi:MAG: glycerophosphodiester phosphodiesterase family protein [Halarsenatibacteraceae bacterium]
MKIVIIILLVLLAIFIFYYGGYYLINPDMRGEDIAAIHNIPHPAVIAHRGASIVAPESTKPAYEIAREANVDYFEADIQMTADEKLIVFHDKNLKRLTNVEEVFPDRIDKEIGELTLEELRQLDYGSWFNETNKKFANENYQGLNILTLDDLIDIARSGDHTPGLILETKYPEKYDEIERRIINTLKDRNWFEEEGFQKTIFFSFSLNSLSKFKELAPDKPRLLLVTDNRISRRSWDNWLSYSDEIVDGLGPKGFMAWPWHIAAAHEKEIFVFPYTVNNLWQVRALAHFQASGFITDRPEVVLRFFDKLPEMPDIDELLETEDS